MPVTTVIEDRIVLTTVNRAKTLILCDGYRPSSGSNMLNVLRCDARGAADIFSVRCISSWSRHTKQAHRAHTSQIVMWSCDFRRRKIWSKINSALTGGARASEREMMLPRREMTQEGSNTHRMSWKWPKKNRHTNNGNNVRSFRVWLWVRRRTHDKMTKRKEKEDWTKKSRKKN